MQVKEQLGSFPPPRRRAHTPYLVIPEASWELARKGSRDPEPASHQTVITGTAAELGCARLGPPLRGAQRGPGGLPGKRSIRIPEAFVSVRPALPGDRRAPGAPREPVPKPNDAIGPGLGLPESLLSSHYPPHPVHRTGNIQIRTRRPRLQSPLP